MSFKSVRISFLIGILLSMACKKEPTTWNNRIQSPLAEGELQLEDLLASGDLRSDSARALSLVREDTLFRLPLDSLLQLPDTTLRNSYKAPFGGVEVHPGQTLLDQNQVEKLQVPKAELTRAVLDQGELEYEITSTLAESTEYYYSIPAARKDGELLEIERVVPPGGRNDPSRVSGTKDLKGYELDLSGPNGSEVNSFSTEMEIRTVPEGDSITLQANDSIGFQNRFLGLIPSFAKGYFGQHEREASYRENELDLFEKVRSGDLDIDSVTVTLTLDNGIAMDARVRVPTIRALGKNGEKELNHPIIGDPINLTRAQYGNGSMEHSERVEVFTPQNSNIDEFLETLPTRIGHRISLETNPLGDVSNGNDIMLKGHDVHARMRIDLPLSLIADDLTLVDTLDWSFGRDRESELQEGTLFLDLENGFPLAAELSLHLHDIDGERLSSLMEDRTIPAAPTDAAWKATGTRSTRIRIPLSPEKAESLREAERMSIVARFNTPAGAPHIDLYEQYGLDFRLSGDMNFKNKIE